MHNKTATWLAWLTPTGAVARGFVFVVIGGTALRGAVYAAGKPGDFPGAFKTIATAPLGRLLLALVGAGLAAFAIARVLEAFVRLKSRAATPWVAQSTGLLLALVYGAFAIFAFRVAVAPSTNQRGRTASWAAWLITQPLGQWLLGAIGVVIVGVGLRQLFTAARVRRGEFWTRCLACYGNGAHALLLLLLGAFAITAAIFRAPGEARGTSGALSFLQHQIFGSVLLAALGLGLVIYGVMSAIESFRAPPAV